MRPRLAVVAAFCASAVAAPAFPQGAAVQDLGHGIFRAAGVMGGTAVRVPQSNTFMIVTRDGNVSTMFGPPSQGYGEIVKLAGGPDAVAARARQLVDGDATRALYLTDMALAVDPRLRPALEVRLAALRRLDAQSENSNERGWLAAGIRDAEARLKP